LLRIIGKDNSPYKKGESLARNVGEKKNARQNKSLHVSLE